MLETGRGSKMEVERVSEGVRTGRARSLDDGLGGGNAEECVSVSVSVS